MIDLFTAEFNSLTNDARYKAIADFAQAQPVESNRHDFKLIWNNDTLKMWPPLPIPWAAS